MSVIFYGNGLAWDAKKNKPIRFTDGKYETSDKREIELLSKSFKYDGEIEDSGLTKKEIIELLDEAAIEYNPRDKKEVLEQLLGE